MKTMANEYNYNTFTDVEKYQLKLLEAAAIVADLNMDNYWIDSDKNGVYMYWDMDSDTLILGLATGMMHIYKIMVELYDLDKKTTYFDLQTRLPKDITKWAERHLEESSLSDRKKIMDFWKK